MIYILCVGGLQLFLLFVRVKAKEKNDRTSITINNPLSTALQGQLEGLAGGAGSMMKTLASSFLSSTTSILEYDLKEAQSMQRGLLFNMAFLWFVHFKLKQVQPLMIQTASGLLNLFYSPLFQIYVLGRNLERPFKTATSSFAKLQEEAQAKEEDPSVEQISVEEEQHVGKTQNSINDETEDSEGDEDDESDDADDNETASDDDQDADED